jgi:hypothetical protein
MSFYPEYAEYATETLAVAWREAWPMLLGCIACHALVSLSMRLAFGAWRHPKQGSVPEIVAYNTTVLVFNLLASYLGLKGWLDGSEAKVGGSEYERIYGRGENVMFLIYTTAAFELYNTVVCTVVIPENRTAAFVGHHVCTLTLALMGVLRPFVNHYIYFFFGSSMISSAPLCASKIFDVLRSRFPAAEAWHGGSRVVFAVLFLIVRITIWPAYSSRYWRDTYAVYIAGKVNNPVTFYFTCFSNVFLTGLQFVWGRLVIIGIYGKLFPQKPSEKKGA